MFPLVALFHFLVLGIEVFTFDALLWAQLVWKILFAITWLFICDLKRWAAFIYMTLTTANLFMRWLITNPSIVNNYTDALFPADVAFTFFVLIYFRKFD